MNLKILLLAAGFCLATISCTKKEDLKKKIFLLNLPFATTKNRKQNCSFARSSLVRNILLKDFYPIFERYDAVVPKGCALNLEQTIYHTLEDNKLQTANGFWKCNVCGKKFYSEEYVYKHFYKKHKDTINYGTEKICLADYCDIFRCDLHEQYPIIRKDFPECNTKKTRNFQRKCEKMVNKCLPTNPMRHRIYDALSTELCAELTCEHFYTQFEDMSLSMLLLLVISIPSFMIGCCVGCWRFCDYLSEEESYVSISEHEERKRERIARVRDAQNANYKNQMGRYGGSKNLHRRRLR